MSMSVAQNYDLKVLMKCFFGFVAFFKCIQKEMRIITVLPLMRQISVPQALSIWQANMKLRGMTGANRNGLFLLTALRKNIETTRRTSWYCNYVIKRQIKAHGECKLPFQATQSAILAIPKSWEYRTINCGNVKCISLLNTELQQVKVSLLSYAQQLHKSRHW